jgi:hypothetical protein
MPNLLKPGMAGFYNRDAFIEPLKLVAEPNIARLQIEEWTRFVWPGRGSS